MPDIRLEALGSVGLNTDVQPSLLPPNALTTTFNVSTEDGVVRAAPGERRVWPGVNFDVKPLYHVAWRDASQDQWVIVSDGIEIYAYRLEGDGTGERITPTDDDTTTGTQIPWSSGHISFAILNGVLVINSVTDGLFFWAGTGTVLVAAPGWDANWRCQCIAAYRYQLVALAMIESGNDYPHKIRWSTSAAEGDIPSQWTILASNDAGDDLLGETEGRIVGGTVIRDQLMIVKEDAVYGMQWIGGQYVMQTARLKGGVGTRNPRGFCEMEGALIILMSSDLLVFDGQTSKSLIDSRVRKTILSEISEDHWRNAQLFYHPPTSRLYVAYPTKADAEHLMLAVIYNTEENTLSVYRLKNGYGFDMGLVTLTTVTDNWDDLTTFNWDAWIDSTWNKGVYEPSVPDVLLYESNDADTEWWLSVRAISHTNSDGTPKDCVVGRQGLPIEGANGMAMLVEVFPELEGQLFDTDGATLLPVYMRFGGQISPEAQIIWDPVTYEVWPGQTQVVDPRVTGRFLAWELSSKGNGSWRLGSLTLRWQPAGER